MWQGANKECIKVQCHDPKLSNDINIKLLSGSNEKWGDFKSKNNSWVWDDGELEDKEYGYEFNIKLFNKCGRQAFKVYRETLGVDIKFQKFEDKDRDYLRGLIQSKQVLFVIDGTGSMTKDLKKAKASVLIFTENPGYKEVAIVIYRSHEDEAKGKKMLEFFPSKNSFCSDMKQVAEFLTKVEAYGGSMTSGHESVLDGLA